jgi:N-acetyl-gamma-glutamylphosphate reductase
MAATKAKIGVLGASGYTGSELVRLLLRHPNAELALLTADRRSRRSSFRRSSRSKASIGSAPAST